MQRPGSEGIALLLVQTMSRKTVANYNSLTNSRAIRLGSLSVEVMAWNKNLLYIKACLDSEIRGERNQ
ncbi:MAG: hypothetical protein HC835_16120 [Oscillatoriales cyanobacterium RM2_1_1]|nr:hypothetical protein [Oscillatoriales cyanobacterium SM2_3_0]NJO47018.1 hypothetical protein [Oscillatoriales cyanobacterium RM2_1_1]